MSSQQPTITVSIITGNIVTPKAVLYSGHVIIARDTICHIGSGTDRIPDGDALKGIVRRVLFPAAEGEQKQPSSSPRIPSINEARGAASWDKSEWQALASAAAQDFTVSSMRVDAPGLVLPGFVDIHNHGLGGVDEVCDHWLVPEFSQRELARCGTLSTLASVIFSKKRPEATKSVIESIEGVVGSPVLTSSQRAKAEASSSATTEAATTAQAREIGCVIEGVHAEGPIIADWGGLPIADADISLPDFKALCASMPSLRIMTISPSKERARNFERIRHLVEIGARPSLGHDRSCTEDDIIGALRVPKQVGDKGTDRLHSTHIYNVMGFHHRNPSLINFLLCNKYPESGKFANVSAPPTVEIICDLIHVNPIAIQSVLSCRQPQDVALISDCISSYHPGKRLKYNGRQIAVRAEGGCYLCDSQGRPTTTLAGSTVTLADQFFTLVAHFRLDVVTASTLLSGTPARIAQLPHVGTIEVGKRANILLLDSAMGRIERRMVYGQWVEAPPYVMLRPAMSSI